MLCRNEYPPVLYHGICLKIYLHNQGKDGLLFLMANHIHQQTSLMNVAGRSGEVFSRMKVLVDFFVN